MPVIHAGRRPWRSAHSNALSPTARTTAAAPSVTGGSVWRRSGETTYSSASNASTVRSYATCAFGLSSAALRSAGRDGGEVRLGRLTGVEQRSGLQRGQRHRVWPERRQHVRVELEGEDLAEVAERRLAEAVDERGVDAAVLQRNPRFVQRPRRVHLDVALGPRRPDADGVERADEAERPADEVVGRAGADEVDVVLRDPDVPEDLREDRHQRLDLVAVGLAAEVVGLGERHDGHRPRPQTGGGRSRHQV